MVFARFGDRRASELRLRVRVSQLVKGLERHARDRVGVPSAAFSAFHRHRGVPDPEPRSTPRALARARLKNALLDAPDAPRARASCAALDNGVGELPAMGYNTWNDLRCEGVIADASSSSRT